MSDPAKQARQAVAIADADIRNVEAELAVLDKQLERICDHPGEPTRRARERLVEKLSLARARHAAIVKRAERVERMAAIAEAIQAISAELAPLRASGARGPHVDELCARAAALRDEALRLKGDG